MTYVRPCEQAARRRRAARAYAWAAAEHDRDLNYLIVHHHMLERHPDLLREICETLTTGGRG